MASVTVRVDEKTKEQATEIVEDFGFDLSSVTRAFYRQIVRERRIPLNLSHETPNDETAAALKEGADIMARGGNASSFSTGRDLLDAAYKA
ncbi:type II toxin-antitoxin system RelB/DinJ family antitoxin [Olsenella sp. Marseille-P4559]|uniref:type II toxin-antitoxin system RelB/DinJ family antitoxin n=1 Tax=Olsenella sp. Marseille-P4559 TaxID=2364795 RepID=UPI001031293F|nr:type II toxin-antitoxin system RelB/DinJ family antitoxin [Olsenella sp. Marseille-P4559]